MDKIIYLLKISGSIGSAKHKEFEQTIRFVFNLLPSGCLSSHLALDVFHPNHYHVVTLWRSGEDMSAFKRSDEFNLLKGSFDTLGFIDQSMGTDLGETQAFRIHVNNTS